MKCEVKRANEKKEGTHTDSHLMTGLTAGVSQFVGSISKLSRNKEAH